jgi:hypothetical protein
MKKLVVVGLAAVGVVLMVRPLMKRKAERMHQHCEQMAARCKEKMAQFQVGGEEPGAGEPPGSRADEVGGRSASPSTVQRAL